MGIEIHMHDRSMYIFFSLKTASAIELLNVKYLKGTIVNRCVFVAIWTVINEGNKSSPPPQRL